MTDRSGEQATGRSGDRLSQDDRAPAPGTSDLEALLAGGGPAPTVAGRQAPDPGRPVPAGTGPISPEEGAGTDRPTAVAGHYLPSLDGVRALAVLAVMAYHLDLGWASGGYLGVDLFFVLSGFLITSLLVEERLGKGRIRLAAFWGRRARRLLPALFLMILVLALFAFAVARVGSFARFGPIDLSGLRGDALATLFYVPNWHVIFSHQSYFAQYAQASPLRQTWSLGIEEQFYLLWPLLLLGVFRLSGGAPDRWRRAGLVLTVAGSVVSLALMGWLYHGGSGLNRVYNGTDTRAFDLLFGAALAMVVAGRPQPGPAQGRRLQVVGLVGLAGFLACCVLVDGTPSWMFPWGFCLAVALCTMLVAGARTEGGGPLAALLSPRPVRWVGKISYGLYLWHWPVFVYLNAASTGISGATLDALRVAVTFALTGASYYLLERPVRAWRVPDWRRWLPAPIGIAATAVAVLAGTMPVVAAAAPAGVPPSLVSAVVPGSGGAADQVPIGLPPGRVPTKADPLRVMLLGDSVMYTAAPGIVRALDATGVVDVMNHSFPGWGLTTDPGWRQDVPGAVAQDHPELVMLMTSWDDPIAATDPAKYRAMLGQAVELMLHPGGGVTGADGVIFLQFPALGPIPFDTAAQNARRAAQDVAWNDVVAGEPSRFPGQVMYLPVAGSVDTAKGGYTAWLPTVETPPGTANAGAGSAPLPWVRVRMTDNTHLCPAGVVRFADAVLADMTFLYRLPPAAAGWWTGAWVHDPRYSTGTGSCPDDQPPDG